MKAGHGAGQTRRPAGPPIRGRCLIANACLPALVAGIVAERTPTTPPPPARRRRRRNSPARDDNAATDLDT